MKIGVIGCAHGELEMIYDTLTSIEKVKESNIDLLICCGDFQGIRNENDLQCMATKHSQIGSFYKYYSGEKVAPILTIFIGGNHEASNYLQELPYGGWVAPNIYYMGNAGCVNVGGIRITGISGIYKKYDYLKERNELPPYNENSKRSVYHIRQLEVFKLRQLSNKIDICLSHDWPQNIHLFGEFNRLVETQPHLRDDIENNCLGNPPTKMLLNWLKPGYWFAAHMHVYFPAVVEHKNTSLKTMFIGLDKCCSDNIERKFFEIFDIQTDGEQQEHDVQLSYDLEWLSILHLTKHLNSTNIDKSRSFTPTQENKEMILDRFDNNLIVPKNFCRTAKPYDPLSEQKRPLQERLKLNPQTMLFCTTLGIDYPNLNNLN